MENEKYVNYYIETLTATLTDCVVRNVSMQANAKLNQDIVNEQAKAIEELKSSVGNLKDNNKTLIDQLQSENKNLRDEINELKTIRHQYENVKSEAAHVETFRNELVKERDAHRVTRTDYENKLRAAAVDSQNKINSITNDFNDKISKLNNDFNNKLDKLNKDHKKQVQELNDKIAYFQMSPAKRKKFDMENAKPELTSDEPEKNETVKDGGVF